MSEPAIVLLSGGLDSATCLAVACDLGHRVTALSLHYGQRNDVELEAAARLATAAGVEHVVTSIDLGAFGGSALTGHGEIPKHGDEALIGTGGIPPTYVPARNTVFLALALSLAEARGARDLFIGVNAADYSGYPDCRGEFIEAFTTLANLATRDATEGGHRLRVHAPLLELTKAQIIALGIGLGVDYEHTVSCYDPTAQGAACGRCESCLLRRRGFRDAGIADPTRYAADEQR